jgi:hypothetical protein
MHTAVAHLPVVVAQLVVVTHTAVAERTASPLRSQTVGQLVVATHTAVETLPAIAAPRPEVVAQLVVVTHTAVAHLPEAVAQIVVVTHTAVAVRTASPLR